MDNIHLQDTIQCKCGWIGKRSELVRQFSATYADEWWECPQCKLDGSEMGIQVVNAFQKFTANIDLKKVLSKIGEETEFREAFPFINFRKPPDSITNFRGDYFFLSNFFPCVFSWNNMTWRSSEHAFQASKAIEKTSMIAIKMATSASEAKWLGGRCRKKINWEEIRYDIMKEIVRAKFSIPDLAQRLIATGEAELIELNTWYDTLWGQCVDSTGERVGQNLLGKILMEIRSDFHKNVAHGR